VCVGAERVARHDHELAGERVGDLVYDALQHGKPQREDDGIGALQRVAAAGGDDRSATDLCASVRADSGPALESRRVSPPEASWRAMADPIPPVPMIAVVMTGTSSASHYGQQQPGASARAVSQRLETSRILCTPRFVSAAPGWATQVDRSGLPGPNVVSPSAA